MFPASLVSAVAASTAFWCTCSASDLPVVDLKYAIHQASFLNSTGGFYNFSNIRFAQPPVGNLRFSAPVAPTGRNTTVDDGSIGRICPQANPAWELIAAQFVPSYLQGKPFNLSDAQTKLHGMISTPSAQDPRTTEDCLFLDVLVPQRIFHETSVSGSTTRGAPVLVWIYGGGYTSGEKSALNAAGLIKASQSDDPNGVIFVSLNYRLGAFGWLAGPTFQSQQGIANAGLYDQRLALQWIRDNIHLFGGDPERVTIIGESAGGGSIMHQITAFGGMAGKSPFQQAILQSPGFQPVVSNFQMEQVFDTFMTLLNASGLEEARQMPSSDLIKANVAQIATPSYGSFSYGPVVDGLFAPATPGKLLLQGSYDKSLRLMLGHNTDEGLIFSSPAITNDTAYNAFLKNVSQR